MSLLDRFLDRGSSWTPIEQEQTHWRCPNCRNEVTTWENKPPTARAYCGCESYGPPMERVDDDQHVHHRPQEGDNA